MLEQLSVTVAGEVVAVIGPSGRREDHAPAHARSSTNPKRNRRNSTGRTRGQSATTNDSSSGDASGWCSGGEPLRRPRSPAASNTASGSVDRGATASVETRCSFARTVPPAARRGIPRNVVGMADEMAAQVGIGRRSPTSFARAGVRPDVLLLRRTDVRPRPPEHRRHRTPSREARTWRSTSSSQRTTCIRPSASRTGAIPLAEQHHRESHRRTSSSRTHPTTARSGSSPANSSTDRLSIPAFRILLRFFDSERPVAPFQTVPPAEANDRANWPPRVQTD